MGELDDMIEADVNSQVKSAIRLQSTFRSHIAKKEVEGMKQNKEEAKVEETEAPVPTTYTREQVENLMGDRFSNEDFDKFAGDKGHVTQQELDDMIEADVNSQVKSAIRLQSTFRSHIAKKEVE